jgi:hypothetical protein
LLLKAIIGLTFPNGFGPVMEAATAIMTSGAIDVPPKPVKMRLRKSPSPSHRPCNARLTPRQIAAWLEFSDQLDRIDWANALVVAAIGAQGDQKAIEKALKVCWMTTV